MTSISTMVPLYSFDIFDTCLCRLCGASTSVYEIISKEIVEKQFGQSEYKNQEYFRKLFVALRERENHHGGDLYAIYTRLRIKLHLTHSVEELVEWEQNTEAKLLKPIVKTLELVNSCRRKGKIAFISDMYLSSMFLKPILKQYGFFKDGDMIYVSEENHAYKSDGSLFRMIHEKESIPYNQWYHFGDNITSDYKVPRRLGIHATHIAYKNIGYESIWHLNKALDYPFANILSGISRALRISEVGDSEQKTFVADLSAPMIVAWITKIMKDAQTKGIRQLFFCARDAHSEYLVARKLQPLFPSIQVKYLFVSRDSMYDNEEMLFAYLKEVGLANKTTSALVDIVSTGKSARIVNTLLQKHNLPCVYCYYLFRLDMNSSDQSDFPYANLTHVEIESLHALIHDSNWFRFTEQRIFFEILFTLNYHKKTIGYIQRENHIRIVFGNDTSDRWVMNDVKQKKKDNDALLSAFTEAFIATHLVEYAEDILKNVVLPTWSSFMECPKRVYLDYLNRLSVNGRPFVSKIRPLQKDTPRWRRGSLIYTLPTKYADKLFRTYLFVKSCFHK